MALRSAVRLLCAYLLGLAAVACIPPSDEAPAPVGVRIDLNDPATRRIYDHQNARNADSLRAYLTDADPSYRYQAARALASFGDLDAPTVTALTDLLSAPEPLLRTAATYALGQAGGPAAADSLAAAFDQSGRYPAYNAAVLEAVGKTGGEDLLDYVASITTYRPTDTLLLAGQATALFRFAARGHQSPAADARMLNLLLDPATPPAARAAAAWHLQRFPVAVDSLAEQKLRRLLRAGDDADAAMAAARTLGRAATPPARVALVRALQTNPDWRVRVAVLRGLAGFDYTAVREPVLAALNDGHPLVRQAAADYLLERGTATDATFYRKLARDSTAADVSPVLYAAAQRHLPLYFADYRGFLNYDLQQAYAATDDAYARAAVVRALGEYPWNYRNLYEFYRQSDQAPVRSAVARALADISGRDDFATFFRASARRVRLDLAGYFREMTLSGEVGPAYAAAGALAEQPEVYRPLYPDLAWLETSIVAAQLPRQVESQRAMVEARAALTGRPAPEPAALDVPAKPIAWERLMAEGEKAVVVNTTAGSFTLRLFPTDAPATVSSFLELVAEGYYDGKVFHRVVPNFVAQGGGPLGDGFGGEDFRLRTETPGTGWDRPGLVGMASAGRDTEGVQFFVTHRPTPHLDGGYTIFGEVTEGQEVVDRLVVGSRIESIELR